MSLITKYRPHTLAEYLGQPEIISTVERILNRNDIPNTFIISGPSGCGKTTLGRCIASELGAYDHSRDMNPDYTEIDAGQFRGIDTVREIRSSLTFTPFGSYRVWLLDEVHALTKDSSEAILKMLEEPPAYCVFILCTTEKWKLTTTIQRRATHIEIPKVADSDIIIFAQAICKSERKKVSKEICEAIAKKADGSYGMALSLLSSVIDSSPEEALRFLGNWENVEHSTKKLCQLLIKRDKKDWSQIVEVLSSLEKNKEEPERVRRAILGYCKACYSNPNIAGKIYLVASAFDKNVWDSGYPGLYTRAYEAFYA